MKVKKNMNTPASILVIFQGYGWSWKVFQIEKLINWENHQLKKTILHQRDIRKYHNCLDFTQILSFQDDFDIRSLSSYVCTSWEKRSSYFFRLNFMI